RVSMTMAASAAMANARRIWRYQQAERMAEQRQLGKQNEQKTGMFMKTAALFRLVRCIWGEMRFFAPPSAFFTYSLNLRTVF
ncbi:hypothetical protein MNBD_CHLOROFLEXI01-2523, partial [hydrothermal vent metagenome]